MLKTVCQSILIAILSLFHFTLMASEGRTTISGHVQDEFGMPVIGASVLVCSPSEIIVGTQTDGTGYYTLRVGRPGDTAIIIKVSTIGFESQVSDLPQAIEDLEINFKLSSTLVYLSTVSTIARSKTGGLTRKLDSEEIVAASNRSIVPTNPVSAIKGPNSVRVGSSHSSKIRVSGSSPTYQINGISIGADPNHFGMFSIIPGPALNRIEFHPLGTPAQYSSPSVIEMQSRRSFKHHSFGEVNISPIEATGTFSIGDGKLFALGSLRKSLLDKLVRHLDIKSDRQTLPPTNFQDLFVSAGLEISPAFHLYVDHLQTRDFLKYDPSAIELVAQSILTIQHTSENYSAVRFNGVFSGMMVNVSGALKSSRESYVVYPTDTDQSDRFNVNLEAGRRTGQLNTELRFMVGNSQIRIGNKFEKTLDHNVSLKQQNWNFLPPDATSDNPHIYQQELNREFGSFIYGSSGTSNGAYFSWNYEGSNIEIESGIRSEYYSSLGERHATTFRNRLTLKTESSGEFDLFAGTFAESPVSRILEPYQVLILDNLAELKPVRTSLLSTEYRLRSLSLGLFAKDITDIPIPTPDFSLVDNDGNISSRFLRATSSGSRRFYGGSISLDLERFFSNRWNFSGSYGYTLTEERTNQIATGYELDAPHRLHTQLGFKATHHINLAMDFSLRSGYRYSPPSIYLQADSDQQYSPEFYTNQLQLERSSRFPTNYRLNLHADFSFGNSNLYVNVANVTNHANPIINTSHGLVYDAGIFPSLGLQVRL